MNGIFWGIFFLSFQLNFLYLNYILPAAGAMVLYLHLRKFSQVNEAFRKAFRFSAALVLYQILSFGFCATRLAGSDTALLVLIFIETVLLSAVLLYLQSGLTDEYQKAGMETDSSHWLIWLVVLKAATYAALLAELGVALLAASIALIVVLIGVYCCFRDAGKNLFSEMPDRKVPARGRRSLVLCTAYACAILLAIIGGAFLGQPGAPELLPLETAYSEELIARGMPREVAARLSKEDIDLLKGAAYFQQLKPYENYGSADTKVITVAGFTDYDQYITLVWFSRDNKKQFSRDVLTLEGDTAGIYKGRFIYTQSDGKEVCRDIDASEIGNLPIPEYADEFDEEYFPGAYLEIPALRSAKKISGYLLFDAGQYMEDDEGDLSEEVGGQIDVAWYGLKRLQFPYLSVPQALDRQAYSSYAEYFYALDENLYDIENWDDSE